jgi:hypothetical protein
MTERRGFGDLRHTGLDMPHQAANIRLTHHPRTTTFWGHDMKAGQ